MERVTTGLNLWILVKMDKNEINKVVMEEIYEIQEEVKQRILKLLDKITKWL